MISFATGTRMTWSGYSSDLDGEGCGPGMMYGHLIIRYLARAGIPCFTGLYVEGGYNWVSCEQTVSSNIIRVHSALTCYPIP